MLIRSQMFQPDSKNLLSGWLFKFDELAECWGQERMHPDIEIEVASDCLLLHSHDSSRPLGKIGKHFNLETKSEGVYLSCHKLPDTRDARDALTLVKEGVLSGMSVGFRSISDEIENKVRVFKKIHLMEVSLCCWPVYQSAKIDKAKLLFQKETAYKKVTDKQDKQFLPPELLC